jgi:hypothetical protein
MTREELMIEAVDSLIKQTTDARQSFNSCFFDLPEYLDKLNRYCLNFNNRAEAYRQFTNTRERFDIASTHLEECLNGDHDV